MAGETISLGNLGVGSASVADDQGVDGVPRTIGSSGPQTRTLPNVPIFSSGAAGLAASVVVASARVCAPIPLGGPVVILVFDLDDLEIAG